MCSPEKWKQRGCVCAIFMIEAFFFVCVFCLVLILCVSVTEILLFGQRDFEVF